MHSADVRITHLESPEIQYLLIGYLLMIALFLPLPLSLSLFASLSSTNIISIKKKQNTPVYPVRSARLRRCVCLVPLSRKRKKKEKNSSIFASRPWRHRKKIGADGK